MERRETIISKIVKKIQHLSDVYPQIETNTILNKTITGIGATYSEIKAPRHSIIIEPTIPVIYGKTVSIQHKKRKADVFANAIKHDYKSPNPTKGGPM